MPNGGDVVDDEEAAAPAPAKSPCWRTGDGFEDHCAAGGCRGEEELLLDVFEAEDRTGGALGARRRLWELRWLSMDWASKPDEERA